MHITDPNFQPTVGANTLAVILHGYRSSPGELKDVITLVGDTYAKDGVNIYAPILPYAGYCSGIFDDTGANQIVINLVRDLDEIWKKHQYERVVLIGHSLGGILARRIFLVGAPNPPDYAAEFLSRDELSGHFRENHWWAEHVERIVLLASWDKGWSVSAGDVWKYTIPLNVLGFLGRAHGVFSRKTRKPGRTMLDMRLGAPFIVQTRLLWMAYRRWHNKALRELYNKDNSARLTELSVPPEEAANPLLVQIIGSKDDFVSPQDQVDYDVDAEEDAAEEIAGADPTKQNKRYYLIVIPGADHKGVVDFTNAPWNYHKEAFRCAFSGDAASLPQYASNPGYFEDMPTRPDPSVRQVVFVMHGIRDNGFWTHRIAKAIKEAADKYVEKHTVTVSGGKKVLNKPIEAEHIASWAHTYGYFAMGAFLLPWIRQQKVEWFMDNYVDVKARYPNATFHYVGHSNGTYLAAKALEDYPAARFGHIYFAGSVVNPKYDWLKTIKHKRVKKIHNARGASDWVVALLPKSIEYCSDLGGAGFDGFEQTAVDSEAISQSTCFAKGQHGGAIAEGHWSEIGKFIVTGDKPFKSGEPCGEEELFQEKQSCWLKLFARLRIGIPLVFSLVTVIVLGLFSLCLPEEYRQWIFANTDYSLGGKFLAGLLTFISVLQYTTKKVPTGVKQLILNGLLVTYIGSFLFFVFAFGADVMAYLQLDPLHYSSVVGRTAGALITLAVSYKIVRFFLTKF